MLKLGIKSFLIKLKKTQKKISTLFKRIPIHLDKIENNVTDTIQWPGISYTTKNPNTLETPTYSNHVLHFNSLHPFT
jgi:hypothetical protein